MQLTSSYIAYLLTKHECVIIPGLGAFIVSDSEESKDKKAGLLCPPGNILGFNSNIRHNDGLLANTIAKGENISYEEACLRIARYSERVTDYLEKQMLVQLPWIGKLELSARRKIVFTPASGLCCNVNSFGMDNFYLAPVSELIVSDDHLVSLTVVQPQKQIPVKKPFIIRRYPAIAAAIIVLLMIAIPVNNQSMQQSQMAQMISFPTFVLSETKVEEPIEGLFEEPIEESVEESVKESIEESIEKPVEESVEKPPEKPIEKPAEKLIKKPAEKPIAKPAEKITLYYIVIASLPTKSSAQVQMAQLKKEGFSNLGITGAGNKYRVYVAKFSDETKANSFLDRFRIEHPKHRDAWLLAQ